MSSYSLKKIVFLSDALFSLTNNADFDEIPHNAAYYLGLHCLQKYRLMSLP